MNDTIPLHTRRMTPTEVLSRLIGWTEGSKSNLVDWDDDLDDLAVWLTDDSCLTRRSRLRELGRILQREFDICIDDWETNWMPPSRRTIRELCERIAVAVEVVVPQPVTVLGKPCLSAGTFLAVRTVLAQAGADVADLGPSSSVTPFVRRWPRVFSGRIVPMAEGRLEIVVSAAARRADRRLLALSVVAFIAALNFFTGVSALAAFVGVAAAIASILAGFGCIWIVRRCLIVSRECMKQIEMAGIHDFRDLVNRILNRPSRRSIFPEALA